MICTSSDDDNDDKQLNGNIKNELKEIFFPVPSRVIIKLRIQLLCPKEANENLLWELKWTKLMPNILISCKKNWYRVKFMKIVLITAVCQEHLKLCINTVALVMHMPRLPSFLSGLRANGNWVNSFSTKITRERLIVTTLCLWDF